MGATTVGRISAPTGGNVSTTTASLVPNFSEEARRRREGPTVPVPANAQGPVVPDVGYVLEEIADGIFWLGDGQYQSMFVVTDESVIVCDAPPTIGHNILRAIDRVTSNPVTDVVYSHHHSDHTGAMSIFPANANYYAQRFTAERLKFLADPGRPLPTHVFDDTLTVDAGDHTLRMDYPGPNHAEGNSFIYAPNQRVLMLVDAIFPGWVPFSNLSLSAFVPGVLKLHDQAMAYDFDHMVTGHVTRPGTPEDVRTQRDYFLELRAAAEAALSSVDLPSTMAPVDTGNAWAVFRAYLDAVGAATADEIVPRWKDRLGGADIFTLPNAWAMAESLRLDWNSLGPFSTVP
jgi:glyoxylase-like metal-dependent hydrolase (beta-lactamase superfamily II)